MILDMAKLESSAVYEFLFPAGGDVALAYFAGLEGVLLYMPRIELADEQPADADAYRLLYRTREMGVYDVLVVCDVRLTVDKAAGVLVLEPAVLTGVEVVEPAVKPDRTVAVGDFSLRGTFVSEGEQTVVKLAVSIVSELPTGDVPWFVPLESIFNLVSKVAQERLAQSLGVFSRDAVAAWRRADGSNWL